MLTADDRSGIDSVRAALRDAILSGDADAYAACFTSDAFVMHQDSPYVQGVEAIKEHTEQLECPATISLRVRPIAGRGPR